MLSVYDGSGNETTSGSAVSGGGGGGGTNPGGGGGVTNLVCASRGGGGGTTNGRVGFGATMGGGTGEVLADPLPALRTDGTLTLLSCPELRAFTESGGPVVVDILERELGPVRRVVCWIIASFRSPTSPMLLRLIRISTMAVRLRWGILRSDSRFFFAIVGGNKRS